MNQQREYVGQFFDANTNLEYLMPRYYDRGYSQFVTQAPVFIGDPAQQDLKTPQALNSYGSAQQYSRSHDRTTKEYGQLPWIDLEFAPRTRHRCVIIGI